MGLGIQYKANDPMDLVPIIKYDARAGRFSKVDRTNNGGGWVSDVVDITNNFKAVFDMENVEVGWMNFNTGTAPDFKLVPIDTDHGEQPTTGHKEGFRVMLKLSKDLGGDIRELCSTAKACVTPFSLLHDEYLAGLKQNPGKLPVVNLKATKAVTSGSGGMKSTNYEPVFEIVQWVPRPADLIFKPKAKTNGAAKPAVAVPAATGNKPMAPPSSAIGAAAGADDFG